MTGKQEGGRSPVKHCKRWVAKGDSRKITYISADSSTPWSASLNLGVDTKTTRREPSPQFAVVLTTSQLSVSLDNSITGIEEVGSAGLELHSVDDESTRKMSA